MKKVSIFLVGLFFVGSIVNVSAMLTYKEASKKPQQVTFQKSSLSNPRKEEKSVSPIAEPIIEEQNQELEGLTAQINALQNQLSRLMAKTSNIGEKNEMNIQNLQGLMGKLSEQLASLAMQKNTSIVIPLASQSCQALRHCAQCGKRLGCTCCCGVLACSLGHCLGVSNALYLKSDKNLSLDELVNLYATIVEDLVESAREFFQ